MNITNFCKLGVYLVVSTILLSAGTAYAFSGTATCKYEIYTPKHFTQPVITEPFNLDLSKQEIISTENPAMENAIRLNVAPGTIDGRKFTHISFSLTYDGAHTGAVIPAVNGLHVLKVGRDGSDIIGAFLFCDVKVNLANKPSANAPVSTPRLDTQHRTYINKFPIFSSVHCVNTREDHEITDILFTSIGGRQYKTEMLKNNKAGAAQKLDLGRSELHVIQDDTITMAGLVAVVEFGYPDESHRATPAQVRMRNPYYDSQSWLCKAVPQ